MRPMATSPGVPHPDSEGSSRQSEPGLLARPLAFFRRHPVALLLLFSPGIPEYLSGSSAVAALVLNPGLFVFQIVANLGLYGPGVLLIREALVRGGKSWPSLLAWGSAYAILEEGVALSTFFNPHSSVVGVLGFYGHFLGVSWVWAIGLLMVHTVYSISLPILLLGLVLPETRAQSLLSVRARGALLAILALDVAFLFGFVLLGEHFWMGGPILLASLAVIGGLVLLGARLGPGTIPPVGSPPRGSPRMFGVLGAALFPGTLLLEGILGSADVPAAGTFVALVGFYVVWGATVLPRLGRSGNHREMVALASGLLAPLLLFGLLSQLYLPLVIVGDVAMVGLLRHLWSHVPPPSPRDPLVPAGARGLAGPDEAMLGTTPSR